ncbi:hypothetical protein RJ639_013524 [Escallonia herrerae]|uniref:H15 domain-containing protein n=1 Tax=Escallonia herrerae TaxID=1293975 RepID=A0AA88VKH1_9ASTE|nr:hypothetical protein RJ639_013524 [Escallonia herrerae]
MVSEVASKKAAPVVKKPRAHPPYVEMIEEAIVALKERTGSSQYAIGKFIEEKQKDHLPSNFKKLLLVQLKKLVAGGKLTKVKNSFKISPAASAKLSTTAAGKKVPTKKTVAEKQKTGGAVKAKKAAATPLKVKRVAPKPAVKKPKKVAKTAAVMSPAKKKAAVAKVKKVPAKKVVKKVKSIKSPVKKAAVKKGKK